MVSSDLRLLTGEWLPRCLEGLKVVGASQPHSAADDQNTSSPSKPFMCSSYYGKPLTAQTFTVFLEVVVVQRAAKTPRS